MRALAILLFFAMLSSGCGDESSAHDAGTDRTVRSDASHDARLTTDASSGHDGSTGDASATQDR